MTASVRFSAEVVGVARRGRDRVVDAGRDSEPLTVHVRDADGREERITARAVIDASGTWTSPNPLGGDGLPAVGETATRERIAYQVPNLTDATVVARYADRHVVVAGAGHSALTALVAFAGLAEQHPSTRITWLLRRARWAPCSVVAMLISSPPAARWACARRPRLRLGISGSSPGSGPMPSKPMLKAG